MKASRSKIIVFKKEVEVKKLHQQQGDRERSADSDLTCIPMEIEYDMSTQQNSPEKAESLTSNQTESQIPDHCWVGEYLDKDEANTVPDPLTYDQTVSCTADLLGQNTSHGGSEKSRPVLEILKETASALLPSEEELQARRRERLLQTVVARQKADDVDLLLNSLTSLKKAREQDYYNALREAAYLDNLKRIRDEISQLKPSPAKVIDHGHHGSTSASSSMRKQSGTSSNVAPSSIIPVDRDFSYDELLAIQKSLLELERPKPISTILHGATLGSLTYKDNFIPAETTNESSSLGLPISVLTSGNRFRQNADALIKERIGNVTSSLKIKPDLKKFQRPTEQKSVKTDSSRRRSKLDLATHSGFDNAHKYGGLLDDKKTKKLRYERDMGLSSVSKLAKVDLLDKFFRSRGESKIAEQKSNVVGKDKREIVDSIFPFCTTADDDTNRKSDESDDDVYTRFMHLVRRRTRGESESKKKNTEYENDTQKGEKKYVRGHRSNRDHSHGRKKEQRIEKPVKSGKKKEHDRRSSQSSSSKKTSHFLKQDRQIIKKSRLPLENASCIHTRKNERHEKNRSSHSSSHCKSDRLVKKARKLHSGSGRSSHRSHSLRSSKRANSSHSQNSSSSSSKHHSNEKIYFSHSSTRQITESQSARRTKTKSPSPFQEKHPLVSSSNTLSTQATGLSDDRQIGLLKASERLHCGKSLGKSMAVVQPIQLTGNDPDDLGPQKTAEEVGDAHSPPSQQSVHKAESPVRIFLNPDRSPLSDQSAFPVHDTLQEQGSKESSPPVSRNVERCNLFDALEDINPSTSQKTERLSNNSDTFIPSLTEMDPIPALLAMPTNPVGVNFEKRYNCLYRPTESPMKLIVDTDAETNTLKDNGRKSEGKSIRSHGPEMLDINKTSSDKPNPIGIKKIKHTVGPSEVRSTATCRTRSSTLKQKLQDTAKAGSKPSKDPLKRKLSVDTYGSKSKKVSTGWMEDYKSWFKETVEKVLLRDEEAVKLELIDPIRFLESVTSGHKKTMSYIPRGNQAKEILKFIALNKDQRHIKLDGTKNSTPASEMEDHKTKIDISFGSETSFIDKKPSAVLDEKMPKISEMGEEDVTNDGHIDEDGSNLGKCEYKSNKAGHYAPSEMKDEAPVACISRKSSQEEAIKKEQQREVIPNEPEKSPMAKTDRSKSHQLVNKSDLTTEYVTSIRADEQPFRPEKENISIVEPAKPNKTCILPQQSFASPAISEEESFTDASENVPTKENEESSQVTAPRTATIANTSSSAPLASRRKTTQLRLLAKTKPALGPPPKKKAKIVSVKASPPIKQSSESSTPKHTDFKPSKTNSEESDQAKPTDIHLPVPTEPALDTVFLRESTKLSESKTDDSTTAGKKVEKTPVFKRFLKSSITIVKTTNSAKSTDRKRSSQSREKSSARNDSFRRSTSRSTDSSDRREKKYPAHSTRTRSRTSSGSRHRSSSSKPVKGRDSRSSSSKAPDERGRKVSIDELRTAPKQEGLLSAFKKHVEKTVLRKLNVLYKFEKYAKTKLDDVAKDIVETFNNSKGRPTAGKEEKFSPEQALHHMKCLFEDPTTNALDDIYRHLSKVNLEDPCFEVDLKAFEVFQDAVMLICHENLNPKMRFSNQDQVRTRYVCYRSEQLFPQFDGEAHIIMKIWNWKERMAAASQDYSSLDPNWDVKRIPEPDSHKSLEEHVSYWLADFIECPLYKYPEVSSCNIILEVKQQLEKRKEMQAFKEDAAALIAKAWLRNYYGKIKDSLKDKGHTVQKSVSNYEELMVLDEVYSDECDADNEDTSRGLPASIEGSSRDMKDVVPEDELKVTKLDQAVEDMRANTAARIHDIRQSMEASSRNNHPRDSRSSKRSSRQSRTSKSSTYTQKGHDAKEEAAVIKARLPSRQHEEHREMKKKCKESERKALDLRKKLSEKRAISQECLTTERIENFFGVSEGQLPSSQSIAASQLPPPVKVSQSVASSSSLNVNAAGFTSSISADSTAPQTDVSFHINLPQPDIASPSLTAVSNTHSTLPTTTVQDLIATQKIQLGKFSGNPLEYSLWESSFEALLVESKVSNIHEKMNLLRQYLGAEPLKLVDGYFLTNTEDSYQNIKTELKLRYGGDALVGKRFLNKLKGWSDIKSKVNMRKFSDFLQEVVKTKRTVEELKTLDCALDQMKIVKKLPFFVKFNWMGIVRKYKDDMKSEEAYPPFENFASFIQNISDTMNMPEFDLLEDDTHDFTDMTYNRGSKSTSCSTNVKPSTESENCLYCDKEHFIGDCDELRNESIRYRKAFFRKKYLCYGCGKRMNTNHSVRNCLNRVKCTLCAEFHLTCMHYDEKKEKYTAMSTDFSSLPSLMTVPVWTVD